MNSSTIKESESGFSLVELLVVILIIGVLAAVAIPAFMDQRKRANDAAVENDVKNVATMVETWMISNPNDQVPFDMGWKTGEVTIGSGDNALTTSLSDGVRLVVRHPRMVGAGPDGRSIWEPDPNIPTGVFEIEALHENGKEYNADGGVRLRYRSDRGGFY